MKSLDELKYEIAVEEGYKDWESLVWNYSIDKEPIDPVYEELIKRSNKEIEKNYENHYTELSNKVMCECGNCFKIRGSLI